MFSKYKKTEPKGPAAAAPQLASVPADVEERKSLMKAMPSKKSAEAAPMDREKKRKERLGEIKLELHKALLDNLNLAALETASENDLRQEFRPDDSEGVECFGDDFHRLRLVINSGTRRVGLPARTGNP